ncbi:DHA1 family bicyclomycin/chloramphenicol resistance-like MFS transporter [Sinobacterium caligoides]|uniref:DHA1 family bicyclomycin/chloramphenicol resistance-like MFS transporter n=1 Tax=Sinobacterium caligoides TaxID=933926 RepID=A0A3N2DQ51_9GAMM|nr:multidrug effflux MFS transporter [Sinobacterium caligoides]ROS01435.1 DHA1 family bicyclomycin/chloramphenicol resistance-like MFS transporter [Sinobacterium caligoides]
MTQQRMGFVETVILMALMIAVVALSIDSMLPALPQIGRDLSAAHANDTQFIVSALFLGLAFGTLIYGPLADSWGRKPVVYLGFVLFIIGCLISYMAQDMTVMLLGRCLQGFGVAAPRVLATTIIRDQYEGVMMAKVMSLVMTVFILMPVVAPTLGQLILFTGSWRLIFLVFIAFGLMTLIWFAVRQHETLAVENRHALSLAVIWRNTVIVVSEPVALGYTIATGIFTGAFLGYLTTSQQIFQDTYGLAEMFPVYFATVALSIGFSSLVNSRLVMRYGMRQLSGSAMTGVGVWSLLFLPVCYYFSGVPPLSLTMLYLLVAFFGIGLLFGNVNSLAMQPLGHVAGIGAGIVGALSMFISIPIGVTVGRQYEGGVTHVVVAMAVCCLLARLVAAYADYRGAIQEGKSASHGN